MIEVNKQELDKIVSENEVVILDFWAPWCGPCKQLIPNLESAEGLAPNVVFVKSNVDNNAELAGEYGVMGVPMLIFFKDGKPVKSSPGVKTVDQILGMIEAV